MATHAVQFSARSVRSSWRSLLSRIVRIAGRAPRSLRLCESVALAERCFVAVVAFERARFLVGGTPSSLALLCRLNDFGASTEQDPDEMQRSAEMNTAELNADEVTITDLKQAEGKPETKIDGKSER